MIRLRSVSSTARVLLHAIVMLALLGGCAGLPRYGTALAPLPTAVLQADDSFVLPDGARLPARVWRPAGAPRAVVLALHGFNDSRDQWEIPGPSFADAGIALYAPDQRGFGAAPMRGMWAGTARMVDDAAAMLAELAARYPGVPLYAMGESMGGAVLMVLAARPDAPRLAGWVLLSPAVWGRQQMGLGISGGLWLVSTLAPSLTVTGSEVPLRVMASDNREALISLARNPLTIRRTRFDTLRGLTDLMDEAQDAAGRLHGRVLVLYGANDSLVPQDAMARSWAAMPESVRQAYYPGGYHLLLRDRGRARPTGDVIAWMLDASAVLPSGADMLALVWRAGRE